MVYQGEREPCGVRGGTLVVLFRYIVVLVQVYYYYSLVKVYHNPVQVYRLGSCSSILYMSCSSKLQSFSGIL